MYRITASIALISSLITASAQESPSELLSPEKKNPSTVRVLAVGESPISRIKMESNSIQERTAYEVEVSPDKLPPKLLFVSNSKEEGKITSSEEQESGKIPVSLGCMSPTIALKSPNLTGLNFSESEDASRSYFRSAFPAGTRNGLVVLSKAHEDKNWKRPRLLFLSDDLDVFPRGSVRVINSSSFQMGLIMEDKKLSLKPGQVHILKPGSHGATPYQVAIQAKDGRWVRIRNTALSMNPGQRVNIVLSNRPSDLKKPAKVNLFSETPTAPSVDQASLGH